MTDIIIKNTKILCMDENLRLMDILIENEKIKKIKPEIRIQNYDIKLDAHKKIAIPSGIDSHVHFRDPGFENKEDWYSGSCSAAAGGVTTVIDHPNTKPPTLDKKSFQIKLQHASRKSIIDYGINGGIYKNTDSIEQLYKCGVIGFGEIFLGNSTGNLNISNLEFKDALKKITKYNSVICIHAENENMIKENEKYFNYNLLSQPEIHSQIRSEECEYSQIDECLQIKNMIMDISKKIKMHFCHISSINSLNLILNSKIKSENKITCEITPHHFILNTKYYKKLKNTIKVNPPIRHENTANLLRNNLNNIDIVASDHAPHLLDEKQAESFNTPSGVPGVETLIPLMLFYVHKNYITLKRMIELTSQNPSQLFGIKSKGFIKENYDADMILFDPKKITKIKGENLHSKCSWTPYEDMDGIFPEITLSRGDIIWNDGQITCKRGRGKIIYGSGKNENDLKKKN